MFSQISAPIRVVDYNEILYDHFFKELQNVQLFA